MGQKRHSIPKVVYFLPEEEQKKAREDQRRRMDAVYTELGTRNSMSKNTVRREMKIDWGIFSCPRCGSLRTDFKNWRKVEDKMEPSMECRQPGCGLVWFLS